MRVTLDIKEDKIEKLNRLKSNLGFRISIKRLIENILDLFLEIID